MLKGGCFHEIINLQGHNVLCNVSNVPVSVV